MSVLSQEVHILKREYQEAQKEIEKNQKELKKLQEEKEKQQKEKEFEKITQYEKDLIKASEQELVKVFDDIMEREGTQKAYLLLTIVEHRNDIIRQLSSNDLSGRWLDNNYERILQKRLKVYQNSEQAKAIIQAEQTRQKQEEELKQWEEEHKEEREKEKNKVKAKQIGAFTLKFFGVLLLNSIFLIFIYLIAPPAFWVMIIFIICCYVAGCYHIINNKHEYF